MYSVHVYGQSNRCWAPIVIDFNAYWAALPTGGCHRRLAGHNCKVQGHGMAGSTCITKVQSHDKGK